MKELKDALLKWEPHYTPEATTRLLKRAAEALANAEEELELCKSPAKAAHRAFQAALQGGPLL